MNDENYMKMAIALAKKGMGKVSPNPLVGAIIVKDNEVIGEGFHEAYGSLHAERNALKNCKSSPRGATMYVTLEPCCHHGKTPPCTEAIIENGIKKVIIGSLDPNEKVAGKGIAILEEAGIEIVFGILENECRELNYIFFHYITQKTPYVLMKYAMTFDGKIATTTGQSRWITNEKSRAYVHKIRNRYTAIMVGIGTVLVDDPDLTCRMENSNHPIRIVCDSTLKTPLDARVVSTAKEIKTIIATTNTDKTLHQKYEMHGVEIVTTQAEESENGKVNLKKLMQLLGQKGIDSILLEGGATLNFSALESEIVQAVQTYIAPKIFGGATAKSPIGGEGFSSVLNKVALKQKRVMHFDDDILIESEVHYVYRNH